MAQGADPGRDGVGHDLTRLEVEVGDARGAVGPHGNTATNPAAQAPATVTLSETEAAPGGTRCPPAGCRRPLAGAAAARRSACGWRRRRRRPGCRAAGRGRSTGTPRPRPSGVPGATADSSGRGRRRTRARTPCRCPAGSGSRPERVDRVGRRARRVVEGELDEVGVRLGAGVVVDPRADAVGLEAAVVAGTAVEARGGRVPVPHLQLRVGRAGVVLGQALVDRDVLVALVVGRHVRDAGVRRCGGSARAPAGRWPRRAARSSPPRSRC